MKARQLSSKRGRKIIRNLSKQKRIRKGNKGRQRWMYHVDNEEKNKDEHNELREEMNQRSSELQIQIQEVQEGNTVNFLGKNGASTKGGGNKKSSA